MTRYRGHRNKAEVYCDECGTDIVPGEENVEKSRVLCDDCVTWDDVEEEEADY